MSHKYFSLDLEGAGDPVGFYSMLSIGLAPVEEPEDMFYRELKPINTKFNLQAMRVGCSELDVLKPYLEIDEFNPNKNLFNPLRAFEILEIYGREVSESLDELLKWVKERSGKVKPVIVTDIPDYDFPGLKQYLVMFGKKNPFGFHAESLKHLYRGRIGSLQGNPKRAFPMHNPRQHHAGHDAVRQAYLAQEVLTLFK